MAWIDLGLRLINRWISPAVMIATARFFLVDTSGREQRFYSAFVPRLNHGDRTVLQVQHWLQVHYAASPTVTALAARAKLGERTFLRRFRHATGLAPSEYLQHLRIERAREELELSSQTISEIVWMVGYQDEGAFRKVFRRITGLAPGDYRRRLSIAVELPFVRPDANSPNFRSRAGQPDEYGDVADTPPLALDSTD